MERKQGDRMEKDYRMQEDERIQGREDRASVRALEKVGWWVFDRGDGGGAQEEEVLDVDREGEDPVRDDRDGGGDEEEGDEDDGGGDDRRVHHLHHHHLVPIPMFLNLPHHDLLSTQSRSRQGLVRGCRF